MAIKVHVIKIAPKYLDQVVAGLKKAELRKNDRDYKAGDVLSLCEWKHGRYTGREWAAVITHILPVNEVMPNAEEWAVLSIRSLAPLDALVYIATGGRA
ncbi:DUF3850 domain-containing protein [Cronobacter sakazakii]|uniref:DUF3850 domain-containing protein n=1 Tax=Cronobacter sakazakii TaxID=28141 RepID=UPI0015583C0B|nr:DUF3850 domain-containing protein [Cronobacter sakazakii]